MLGPERERKVVALCADTAVIVAMAAGGLQKAANLPSMLTSILLAIILLPETTLELADQLSRSPELQ
jgi:hypothetical protein